MNIFVRSSRDL